MAYPPRQFQIGGVYHLINRGVDKRRIFLKNQDYSRFILGLYFFNDKKVEHDIWYYFQGEDRRNKISPILGPSEGPNMGRKRNEIIELLAFALMPNHYHLVVREVVDGGISLFMQKMGGYSSYFNKQYNREGALFQSRYKSVYIKDEIQLGNVFAYVHTNPVELKEKEWKDFKVKSARNAINWLETYRWSSYHDYMGNASFPMVTERDFFLDFYKGEKGCRQAVEDWIKFKAENISLSKRDFE